MGSCDCGDLHRRCPAHACADQRWLASGSQCRFRQCDLCSAVSAALVWHRPARPRCVCTHIAGEWCGPSSGAAGGGSCLGGGSAGWNVEWLLGGGVDRVLVLLMDTLYTLPVLLLSVVLAFLLGRGIPNAAAALCVVYIPQYFRVVRNQTAQVKSELFVEAAKTLGAGPIWILRRYLFRNVITSVPVLLTLNAADAVLVLGGLGFLGLGLPETVPEWGSDLNLALAAVPTGIWWTALYPGLAMFVLVLGLSFLGEGLEAWVSSTGRDAAN